MLSNHLFLPSQVPPSLSSFFLSLSLLFFSLSLSFLLSVFILPSFLSPSTLFSPPPSPSTPHSYFIFTSFWQYKIYYVFGFMLLVFVIMTVVTVCVTIVCTYFLLNSEDYRW